MVGKFLLNIIVFSVLFFLQWGPSVLLGGVTIFLIARHNDPEKISTATRDIFVSMISVFIFGALGSKLFSTIMHVISTNMTGERLNWTYGLTGNSGFGFLFGAISASFFIPKMSKKKTDFYEVADFISPFILLYMAFLRINCLIGGCCYGVPTSLPWGYLPRTLNDGIPRHPVPLYSMLGLVAVYIMLRKLYKKGQGKGVVLFASIAAYSLLRFFLAFLRDDRFIMFGAVRWTSVAQVFILLVFVLSVAGLFYHILKNKKEDSSNRI